MLLFGPVLCFVSMFSLIPGTSFSQETAPGYSVTHWSIEDGLPVNQVTDIWKTTDGYLWLRTSEALTRFDGKTFTNYTSANTPAFLSSTFNFRSEKGIDQFWINNGLNRELRLVRYKDGEFRHFPFPQENQEFTPPSKNPFDMDSNGVLWVAGADGLYKFEDEAFVKVFADEINQEILAVRAFEQVVLAATEQGFYLINDGSVSFTAYDNQHLDRNSFMYEEPGTIWVFNSDSLTSLSGNQVKSFPALEIDLSQISFYRRLSIDSSDPDQVILSSKNAAYILKGEQFEELHVMDVVREAAIPFLTEHKRQDYKGWLRTGKALWHNNTLVTPNIEPATLVARNLALFVDAYGSAWIGTPSGLYKYTKSLFTSYGEEDGIINVYPLLQDYEGAIWAGARKGGISRILDEHVERIVEEDAELPRVFSFYENPVRNIWLGTSQDVRRWNTSTRMFQTIPSPFEGPGARVRVLREKEPGIVYAGTRRGLYEYHTDNDEWKIVPEKNGEVLMITQMYTGGDGVTWVGTERNGLFYLSQDTLRAFPGNSLLSDVKVRSLFIDKQGILWTGFQGGGLNRVRLDSDGVSAESVTVYTPDDGLFGSVIHTLLEDEYERLWMSSNQGIFWAYKEQLNQFAEGAVDNITPIIYQEKDGLPGNEANGDAQNPGLIAKDGAFWFAMLEGVTRVHPDDVKQTTLSFPAKIETIVCADSAWMSAGNTEFRVSKEHRNIDIYYTAFNYEIKPENIHFAYQLEGLHEDWVYAGNERSVSFTDVPAGEYTFRVKAGLGGQWDEENAQSVAIIIEPYFYETSWFFALAVFTGVFSFIGLILWGNRKLDLQKKLFALEVQEQETALSENEQFLQDFQNYVEERIQQSPITGPELSLALNVSERQLYRKVKKATGLTPLQFVREIRLKKAHQILERQQAGTVAEVANSVGFSTPFYFTQLFKERFEYHPGDLIK
ncbi:MAG: helix-turn-helix domain-containing protein [Balneolales bacterium]|nr:helix-turn-helix domain-containing protein [Balneolales bacterium]